MSEERNDKKQKKTGALEPAKIHKLPELVNYADGSVVSRTIAKTKTATVTLFSFDQGQSLSEHSAPFDAMVQVLDGEAELVIGGESIIAQAGETVVMPANIPHGVNAIQKFKMLLTMLRE